MLHYRIDESVPLLDKIAFISNRFSFFLTLFEDNISDYERLQEEREVLL